MSGRCLASLFAAAALALSPPLARAAQPPQAADWPCQQRLVPVITAGTIWTGPPLEGIGDWQADPRVAALVNRISPRDVSAADGEKAIADFIERLHDEDRTRLVTLTFAGLLEQTNHQRQFLIERIEDLGERQHKLANLIAQIIAELDAIPPDAKGDAAAQRADLEQRRAFTTRSFESVQRTMRYACEAPVQLDARLGAYARMLAQALETSPPPHRQ
jgi:hypothetical protein